MVLYMSFKILHIVNDEKFINFIADVFNDFEAVINTFIVIVPDTSISLRHISNLSNIRIVNSKSVFSCALKKDLSSCNALIVHFNDPIKAMMTLRAPKNIPVVWSGWGLDYYDNITKCNGTTLGVESTDLQSSLDRQSKKSTSLLSLYAKTAKETLRTYIKNAIFNKFIARVDYFSSPIPEDFEILKLSLGDKFKATFVQLNYGSVNKTFARGPVEFTGDEILVGNSATITNNHLEIFKLLSGLDLGGRKIIVPLSYGNSDYRDLIIKKGHEYFGEQFYPLVDFVSLENYNNIIANCSVVVMGHRRQQGIGNTATMLYKGARVFLDEASTAFDFFTKLGAVIFCLNDLKVSRSDIFLPLSRVEQKKNREVIQGFWGDDIVRNNANVLVETLKSHSLGINI